MGKSRDLFMAPSIYSLLFYTLINENWTRSDYVLSDRIPLIVHDSLRKKFGCYVYTYLGSKRVGYLKRLFVENYYYFKYWKEFRGRKYETVWGNDDFTASFLYRNQGIVLVEDGAWNAETRKFIKKLQWQNDVFYLPFWFYWLYKNYTSYGWDKRVKTIYHTPAIELPEQIMNKGVCIDLQKTWDSISNQRKHDILALFGIDDEFLGNINNYSTVLITQELPIPEEDKIAIYKKMTVGMDMSKVLIKTHYAETTDYKAVFPESTIISMPVPMQLFSLIGYSPTKVMTISSGAVGPFIKEGVEVVFLGTEIDKRLVAKYGVMTKETYMVSLKR